MEVKKNKNIEERNTYNLNIGFRISYVEDQKLYEIMRDIGTRNRSMALRYLINSYPDWLIEESS